MTSVRRCLQALIAVSILSVVAAPAAFAQGGTSKASMSGKVSDPTGGVLPGLTVTITSQATTQQRSVVTNGEGVYRFAGLPPGKYSGGAELEGFAKFTQADITLQVGTASDLNIVMRLSTVSESVTVNGQAAIIE